MQTVICMKWGTAFGADYVNRLYRGVMRNVARPTRFVVLTDDPSGLADGVERRADPADPPRRGHAARAVAQARPVVTASWPTSRATCCSSTSTS